MAELKNPRIDAGKGKSPVAVHVSPFVDVQRHHQVSVLEALNTILRLHGTEANIRRAVEQTQLGIDLGVPRTELGRAWTESIEGDRARGDQASVELAERKLAEAKKLKIGVSLGA